MNGKQRLALFLATVLAICLLAGCAAGGAQPPGEDGSPDASGAVSDGGETPDGFSFADLSHLQFWFGSGAGGWCTVLTVESDGTFQGAYTDSDMGSGGADYPYGVQYLCSFTGQLRQPVRVNDYTYSAAVERIDLAMEPGIEEIWGGVRHIYSEPYGLDEAEELLFYLPGAPVADLPEDYQSWMGGYGDEIDTQLPFYGLYNVNGKQGFSSHPITALDQQLSALEQETAALERKLGTETLTQLEMTETAQQLYQLWDDQLNQLWSQLKAALEPSAMDALTAEQLQWIADKEAAITAAGDEVAGGTLQPMAEAAKGAEMTRARVYGLAYRFSDALC